MTLWPRFFRRRPRLPGLRTELWPTSDGDEVELLRLDAGPQAPHFLVLHGLEGSYRSHYVGPLLLSAWRAGWSAALLLFRGCGSRPNKCLGSYHSGETGDLDMVVRRIRDENPGSAVAIAGISLGGNVLLKWLGERGSVASDLVQAAVAVSVPYDLERSARHISEGLSRIYERHFVRSLIRKARAKLERFPEAGLLSGVEAVRSLVEFDDAFTAPVHGFQSASEYYARCSSLFFLDRIRVPTLLLSARDDPFHPTELLDEVRQVAVRNPVLRVEFHPRG
ncbi:MAG TPA: alpha/beta fold hydrolase, partial [Gemmatimonadaceae bacterium]|nr:alpha/beta fold hydrolase [Gemmatimonadaceae bacterium]